MQQLSTYRSVLASNVKHFEGRDKFASDTLSADLAMRILHTLT